tara:strand:- start:436 stop:552 length:117 start_codon:yes stop_codon:yes gene_type:complete
MPSVGGKKYSYTPKGMAAAKKAKKKAAKTKTMKGKRRK